MSPTNLELYEALKKSLDEDAARMLAEVVPAAADVATKDDIARLEKAIARLEEAIARLAETTRADIARLAETTKADIAMLEVRLLRRTLTFFLPLWVAVLVALVTVILQA